MVLSLSKWAIIGAGVIIAGLFFREAAATSLTGTLQRTGLAGQELGSGIQSTLTGVGAGSARLTDPLFSLVDLFRKVGDLFPKSPDNVNIVTQGGGMNLDDNAGGGITPTKSGSKATVVSSSNSWSSAAKAATGTSFRSTGSNWG